MIGFSRRDSLGPAEMFPAGDPAYVVSFPRLQSGNRIRAVERGDPQAPTILFVHGWGCSAYVFRFNMPALANAGFRVIAIDLKGHGLSDKPQEADEYTIDALVEHLREVLDALGLDRPALAGHSLGGSLVYHFAGKYPERVRCLGLISPTGLTGVPRMGAYHFLTPAALVPLYRRVRSRAIVRAALRRVYGKRGHFTPRDVEEYFAPAVGVWGSRDHMMAKSGMDIYRRLVPNIVLREVPDAGHVVAEEAPGEVNEAVLSLLQRVYFG